jgi:Zn-dependent peptidase ImmA (M78 family)
VPDSCDSIEISIISDEDAKKYDGPGPGGGGYLTANIAVAITNADSNASSIRYSLMHEMTHWLALCTGLYTSGDGVADRKHADERLWSAEGVVMRAWNAPADL